MITKCRKEGMLKGLRCRDEANGITNLQYADDTLLFGIVSLPQTLVLKVLLKRYKLWSSLKINFQKSSLIFLDDITASSFLISLVFKWPVQRLPITYLGSPLFIGSLNKQFWRPLVNKNQKRLAGWKGRMLSLEGRIIMINAALTALSTYSLSFFALPRWVEMEIDSLMRKFLWGGTQKNGKAFCLVNWKWVCKRKEFGGLGIINLWDFNKALLLKWWWKLFDDQKRIWAKLISQSYRPSSGWWSERYINRLS